MWKHFPKTLNSPGLRDARPQKQAGTEWAHYPRATYPALLLLKLCEWIIEAWLFNKGSPLNGCFVLATPGNIPDLT